MTLSVSHGPKKRGRNKSQSPAHSRASRRSSGMRAARKIKNTYRQEGLMLKQSLGRGPRRRSDHRGSLRKGLFISVIWTMRIKCER